MDTTEEQELQDQLEAAELRIEELQDQLEEAKREIEDLRDQLYDAEDRADDLSSQLEYTSGELDEAQERLNSLEQAAHVPYDLVRASFLDAGLRPEDCDLWLTHLLIHPDKYGMYLQDCRRPESRTGCLHNTALTFIQEA